MNTLEHLNIVDTPTPFIPRFELKDGMDELVRKITEIKDTKEESVVVLVAGGSASGKTSFVANPLVDQLSEEAVLISMDNYYRGKAYMDEYARKTGVELTWDQPEAVDLELFTEHLRQLRCGSSIEMPKYDMKTGERVASWDPVSGELVPGSTVHVDSRKIIVVEGLFALNEAVIKEGDLKVFVEVSTHGRVMRRLMRDANSRTSQSPSQVLAYVMEVVEPMSQKYIDNTEKNADLIITNEYDPEKEAKGKDEVQLKFPGTIHTQELQALGAKQLAKLVQRDNYYQPKTYDHIPTGESVRIREENGYYIFTYKGLLLKGEYREYPKIEFDINREIKKNFEDVYGDPVKVIVKTRDKYELGGITFTLDNVNKELDGKMMSIGQFIEIQTANNKAAVERFIEQVGLDVADLDRRSYAEM